MKDQGTKYVEALSKLEQLRSRGIKVDSLEQSIKEKAAAAGKPIVK